MNRVVVVAFLVVSSAHSAVSFMLVPAFASKSVLKLTTSSSLTRSSCFRYRSQLAMSSTSPASTTTTATTAEQIIPGPELPPIPATCKRLFLVRHGEVINPGGDRAVFYGGADVPLSELGKEEAKVAAQYLQQFDLSLIVSSPLSRAVFGANQVMNLQQQVSSATKHELLILDGLTELNRGAWGGKTKEEIGADMMKRFDACDESVTPEGGESYPALKRRVLEARDEVLRRLSPGQAACIVSHLQVTRSMLSDALQIPTDKMAQLKVATASITCIDYDATGAADQPQVVRYQSFKPDLGLQEAKDGAN